MVLALAFFLVTRTFTLRLPNPGVLAILYPLLQYLHVVYPAASPRNLDEGHAQVHESSRRFLSLTAPALHLLLHPTVYAAIPVLSSEMSVESTR